MRAPLSTNCSLRRKAGKKNGQEEQEFGNSFFRGGGFERASRSQRVTQFLRQQGFEQAQNLTGGIDAWSLEVDPGVPRHE